MRCRSGVTETSFCDPETTASAAPLHPRAASAAQRLRSDGATVTYFSRWSFGVELRVAEEWPTIHLQFRQPISDETVSGNSCRRWQLALLARRDAPPQLVEEGLQEDHVVLRLLVFHALGRHER